VGQSKLVEELSLPEYADLTDQEAADAINAKLVPVRMLIDLGDLKVALSRRMLLARLELMAWDAAIPIDVRALCLTVVRYVDDSGGRLAKIDPDDPGFVQMVESLVELGHATPEVAGEINELGWKLMPWPQANGLPEIGVGFVRNARKEIGG
jgi:hypothetical protein